MAYTDYDFYTDRYYGNVLTSENADKFLERASDFVDTITYGRLVEAFPVVEAHAEKVKKAVCAVAEALYLIDLQGMSMRAQEDENGQVKGIVTSLSSGKESVSYATPSASLSAYAAANVDTVTKNKLLGDTATQYLANVPSSKGINLLYGGF